MVKLAALAPVNRARNAERAACGRRASTRTGTLRRPQRRPRDTRSISSRTSRSTSGGRLPSSQSFSMGRSISATKSSSVRAFCARIVWASALKAPETVVFVVPS